MSTDTVRGCVLAFLWGLLICTVAIAGCHGTTPPPSAPAPKADQTEKWVKDYMESLAWRLDQSGRREASQDRRIQALEFEIAVLKGKVRALEK